MDKNLLFYGDNLDVMRKYIKDSTVDLCYIDPPFNSKRNYNQIYNNLGSEDKAQAQAFIDTWTWNDDSIEGLEQIKTNYNHVFTKQSIELINGLEKVLGKDSLFAYLVSMTLRIAEIQRVLKPTGMFYLHCDPNASHYLKLVLDGIFVPQGGDFRNELIWCYSGGGIPKKDWARKHDVILRYSKSNKYIFNVDAIRQQYSPEIRSRPKSSYAEHSYRSNPGAKTEGWDLNPKGKHPDDWFYMPIINPDAKERLGYPTQKPEALLENIINSSSNEGDLVLDAYCGCGTSVAVAERQKRQWIGIDITYQSISLILKRIEDTFGKESLDNIVLNGIPEDFNSAVALAHKQDDKTRKEFEKWAVLTYSNNKAFINEKKGSDKGIDGIAYMQDRDDNGEIIMKQVLFSVKSDRNPHVSYIRDLAGTLEREKAAMGYFITLYPPTTDMIKECKQLDKYTNKLMGNDYPKIEIIKVEDILSGSRIPIPTSHQIDVFKTADAKKKAQATLL
jgi:site-specific DNA-methyltransferase (adenine-specific)